MKFPGEGTGEAAPRQPAGTPALGLQAAAHEVDDFHAVTIIENCFGPAVARYDVAIQFDRHAVGLDSKGFDQVGNSEGRFEAALVTVDVEFHTNRQCTRIPGTARTEIGSLPRTTNASAPTLNPLCGGRTFWWWCGLRSW